MKTSDAPQGKEYADVQLKILWGKRVFLSIHESQLVCVICPLWSHESASAGWMQVELTLGKHPGFWDIFRLLKKFPHLANSTYCAILNIAGLELQSKLWQIVKI